jgi:hypothetical protein
MKNSLAWDGSVRLSSESDHFALELSLASGQSFAWRCENGFWRGTIRDAAFILQQKNDQILFQSSIDPKNAQFVLSNYLALDEDHKSILKVFQRILFYKKPFNTAVD